MLEHIEEAHPMQLQEYLKYFEERAEYFQQCLDLPGNDRQLEYAELMVEYIKGLLAKEKEKK